MNADRIAGDRPEIGARRLVGLLGAVFLVPQSAERDLTSNAPGPTGRLFLIGADVWPADGGFTVAPAPQAAPYPPERAFLAVGILEQEWLAAF
jgi:hypothetical protein